MERVAPLWPYRIEDLHPVENPVNCAFTAVRARHFNWFLRVMGEVFPAPTTYHRTHSSAEELEAGLEVPLLQRRDVQEAWLMVMEATAQGNIPTGVISGFNRVASRLARHRVSRQVAGRPLQQPFTVVPVVLMDPEHSQAWHFPDGFSENATKDYPSAPEELRQLAVYYGLVTVVANDAELPALTRQTLMSIREGQDPRGRIEGVF